MEELGSTGTDAMLVFHALEDGNGTKPLRLARLPVLMFPHATAADAVPTVMLRLAVAVSIPGWVESVAVIVTGAVPCTVAVPVIAPVELLIDNPLGRPLAL